jgi:hypothetical protein
MLVRQHYLLLKDEFVILVSYILSTFPLIIILLYASGLKSLDIIFHFYIAMITIMILILLKQIVRMYYANYCTRVTNHI